MKIFVAAINYPQQPGLEAILHFDILIEDSGVLRQIQAYLWKFLILN